MLLRKGQRQILRDSSDEEARACGAAIIRPLAAFYKQIMAQGQTDGSLRIVDPMHLYITIVGACDFLYSGKASLSYGFGLSAVDEDVSKKYDNHLITMVMTGLRPKQGVCL